MLDKNEISIIPFGKSKDLTNQKFNHLTVLGRDGNKKGKNIYLICQCDCDEKNIVSLLKSNVTSGKTKSCGCVRREKSRQHALELNSKRKIDLVGQVFGNLLVIEEDIQKSVDKKHCYWKCKCLICNREELYSVRADSLTSGLTTCCNYCSNLSSMGEITIEKILKENNIFFQKEKRYNSCRFKETGAQAKFDFYIQHNNKEYLIEFDGKQHFIEYEDSHFASLKYIQSHDNQKNEWCKKNNIPLIRIPYTHLNKICLEDLLLETSNFII